MEEEKNLTREQKIEIEEKAIQALLDMGTKFSVKLNKLKPREAPFRIRWWNRHFPKHLKVWRDKRIPKGWDVTIEEIPNATMEAMEQVYMRNFHVMPLYLGTMDMIRKLYLQIEYDEESLQKKPINESNRLFKYIPIMAEIVAVAIINNPTVTDPKNRKIKALQKFFIEHLTAARLNYIVRVISQMMNPGAFTNSIRSIREIRITQPKADLIETKD